MTISYMYCNIVRHESACIARAPRPTQLIVTPSRAEPTKPSLWSEMFRGLSFYRIATSLFSFWLLWPSCLKAGLEIDCNLTSYLNTHAPLNPFDMLCITQTKYRTPRIAINADQDRGILPSFPRRACRASETRTSLSLRFGR